MKLKKLLIVLVVAALAVASLTALVGCTNRSSVQEATTRFYGRTCGFTVIDFNVNYNVGHARYQELREAWNSAEVAGDALATNIARAELPVVTSQMFTFDGFANTSRPTQARAAVALGGVFGETNWVMPNASGIGNYRAVGQGFITNQTISHPASTLVATPGAIERSFSTANIAAWFNIDPPPAGGTVESPIAPIWTTAYLVGELTTRWNATDIDTVADRPETRAVRRAAMLDALNRNILSRDLYALGYRFITDLTPQQTGFPFDFFNVATPSIDGAVPVVVHAAINTWNNIFLQRHVEFTVSRIATYYSYATIDELSLETVSPRWLDASGRNAVTTNVLVDQTQGHVALTSVFTETTVSHIDIQSDIIRYETSSTYLYDQLHSVTFVVYHHNTEGGVMLQRSSRTQTFIVNRPVA